jgi:hypothetical protein
MEAVHGWCGAWLESNAWSDAIEQKISEIK